MMRTMGKWTLWLVGGMGISAILTWVCIATGIDWAWAVLFNGLDVAGMAETLISAEHSVLDS